MKRITSIFAGAFLLVSGAALNAQDATIRIHDAGTGQTIPAAIYGQFSEHLGRCIYGGLWVGKDSQVPNVDGYRKDVFDALKALIESGQQYDQVIAIGPLIMMKFVCKLTKEYGVKTIVSMNPIMIDGTGMCGGCRLTVGGETKFACVDGPDFDGHLVDFDEAMQRGATYRDFEAHAREEACNLFAKEVQ